MRCASPTEPIEAATGPHRPRKTRPRREPCAATGTACAVRDGFGGAMLLPGRSAGRSHASRTAGGNRGGSSTGGTLGLVAAQDSEGGPRASAQLGGRRTLRVHLLG